MKLLLRILPTRGGSKVLRFLRCEDDDIVWGRDEITRCREVRVIGVPRLFGMKYLDPEYELVLVQRFDPHTGKPDGPRPGGFDVKRQRRWEIDSDKMFQLYPAFWNTLVRPITSRDPETSGVTIQTKARPILQTSGPEIGRADMTWEQFRSFVKDLQTDTYEERDLPVEARGF